MKYELKELTEDCGIGACPSVLYRKVDSGKETYVIIGKKIPLEKVASLGLESKVGSDETIIEIDKNILDKIFKH